MNSQHTSQAQLQIVSDIICPWCFIGKRSLDQALAIVAEQGRRVTVEWLPFQLNPDLPPGGMDRKTFRSARFGSWANALAMDARAVEAGRSAGAEFRYERQSRTSNTLAGHALARLALHEGGHELQSRVMEALYAAYFTEGEDVGDHAVLERIAVSAGMAAAAMPRAIPLQAEVTELERSVRAKGLTGVPGYLREGRLFLSGAQSVEGLVQALKR